MSHATLPASNVPPNEPTNDPPPPAADQAVNYFLRVPVADRDGKSIIADIFGPPDEDGRVLVPIKSPEPITARMPVGGRGQTTTRMVFLLDFAASRPDQQQALIKNVVEKYGDDPEAARVEWMTKGLPIDAYGCSLEPVAPANAPGLPGEGCGAIGGAPAQQPLRPTDELAGSGEALPVKNSSLDQAASEAHKPSNSGSVQPCAR